MEIDASVAIKASAAINTTVERSQTGQSGQKGAAFTNDATVDEKATGRLLDTGARYPFRPERNSAAAARSFGLRMG